MNQKLYIAALAAILAKADEACRSNPRVKLGDIRLGIRYNSIAGQHCHASASLTMRLDVDVPAELAPEARRTTSGKVYPDGA
jgi:hypothetical protein